MSTLLIITNQISMISEAFPQILKQALRYTKNSLSIHVDHEALPTIYPNQASHLICSMYATVAKCCPNVDVRVLLPGLKNQTDMNFADKNHFENIVFDLKSSKHMVTKKYNKVVDGRETYFLMENSSTNSSSLPSHISTDKVFNEVVIGGTFDRIHLGHKVFLSETLLRTRKRLTIGLSEGPLLAKKTLKELIHPYETRKKNLLEFLTDIDSSVNYNVACIEEPMGPTSWDETLELLVVSEETLPGVDYINTRRANTGLGILKYHCVGLLSDIFHKAGIEEMKFSSSSERLRLLGTRLKQPQPKPDLPKSPYIIGLTGGSASGKTNISSYLKEKGAVVIECDKLGHEAYKIGSDGHRKIIAHFGNKVVADDGSINRTILGQLVFANPNDLEKLNQIVWPEIADLFLKQFEVCKTASAIILDAAILLEANWDKYCHEVWTTFITKEEAINRIMKRDDKSKEQATNRIESQLSNSQRIDRSHIVFSSQWAHEYTKSQVEKAWNVLCSEGRVNQAT